MPEVTVLMPVHNEPEMFLRAAINSILNQTFTDFEFIIVDDASGEKTQRVLSSYNDKRIKLYRNRTNLKVTKTLNKGLKLAQGKYIARMDADDISFRNRLEMQVEYLNSHPKVGLLNGRCYKFPNKSMVVPPENDKDIKYFLRYGENCIVHPLVMMRSSVLEKNNLSYSEKYLHIEDYRLWTELANVADIYTLPAFLLLHRDWNTSVSAQNRFEQWYNAQTLAFDSIMQDLGINKKALVRKYRKQFYDERISITDFIEYDNIIHLAMREIDRKIDDRWKRYLINSLNNKREYLYKKVNL